MNWLRKKLSKFILGFDIERAISRGSALSTSIKEEAGTRRKFEDSAQRRIDDILLRLRKVEAAVWTPGTDEKAAKPRLDPLAVEQAIREAGGRAVDVEGRLGPRIVKLQAEVTDRFGRQGGMILDLRRDVDNLKARKRAKKAKRK